MLGGAPADEAAIGSVMSSYEAALNASNTDAVTPLYAEDGVFMAPNNKSAVGKAAVRRAYDAVFKAIMLKVKFTIVELVVISPQWAYVRTNSAGTQKVNWSHKRRSKPGAFHLQEERRRQVADRPLQLFHHQSVAKPMMRWTPWRALAAIWRHLFKTRTTTSKAVSTERMVDICA